MVFHKINQHLSQSFTYASTILENKMTYNSIYNNNGVMIEYIVTDIQNIKDINKSNQSFHRTEYNKYKEEIFGRSIDKQPWNIEKKIDNKTIDKFVAPYNKFSKCLNVFKDDEKHKIKDNTDYYNYNILNDDFFNVFG